MAANTYPALNDVMYSELVILTEKVADLCPEIRFANLISLLEKKYNFKISKDCAFERPDDVCDLTITRHLLTKCIVYLLLLLASLSTASFSTLLTFLPNIPPQYSLFHFLVHPLPPETPI